MSGATVRGAALAAQARSTWTAERVEQLMEMFDKGLMTAEIGRRMGITKNAVIGKLHRLGLCKEKICSTATSNPFPGARACLWPHGHPGEAGFHFCGDAVLPGKPYCAEHAALAYERPKVIAIDDLAEAA